MDAQELKLTLGDEAIEFVGSFKYLGVVFDSLLSWHCQVASVKKRSAIALYRSRMNDSNRNMDPSHYFDLSAQLKRKLVSALVLPVFDYCACVLTNLTFELERSLLVSLKNCVRFIFRIKRYKHITEHRRRLNWLVPRDRRLLLISCEFYKALCLMRPGLFGDKLELRTNIAMRRDLSKTDTLKVPFARTTAYQRSFINSLPIEVTSAATLEEFRNIDVSFLR
ncbi:Protein of unknown function [Cotesia congregata]|uniref:Uncharacterized protein n=1 Tax=Cotesia congregata TaxID=51543 RepID=A0A8J2EFF3_COTCN|nr:Protein of unknown function [Cotesia congregata]